MLVAENLPYYQTPPNAQAAERCTVFVHRPADDGYPVFVYFHGGGLAGGGRGEGDPFVQRMVAEGFGVVTAEYRVSPKSRWPAYNQDAAAAVAWTIEHVAEFGGDPGKVFVTGHSAGGYLAAITCLDARRLAAVGHRLDEILGCVPTSGQMLTHFTIRDDKGIDPAQPTIDEDAPLFYAHCVPMPMLCVVGSDDMPARLEENALMVAVRKANGLEAELHVEPGRDHCTVKDHYARDDDPVAAAILTFARRLLGRAGS